MPPFFVVPFVVAIDHKLRIIDRFDFPIGEFIEIADMLIVRLDKPVDIVYNENVFGVSLIEKKITWRIAKRKYSNEHCRFTGIQIFKDELVLINWCSIYFTVDPLTGEILEEGWLK